EGASDFIRRCAGRAGGSHRTRSNRVESWFRRRRDRLLVRSRLPAGGHLLRLLAENPLVGQTFLLTARPWSRHSAASGGPSSTSRCLPGVVHPWSSDRLPIWRRRLLPALGLHVRPPEGCHLLRGGCRA